MTLTSAAAKRLKDLNPDVDVIEHKTVVNSSNVLDLIKDYDIVIDGTDNFPTRYCVGDACVIAKKPNVYGSIFRFEGMVTVFAPHLKNPDTGERGPCYRCMFPEPPDPGSVPSCAEGGVIGVLPGIGPALTVALLLPVTYRLEPVSAFIMFAGIYYGGMYGGSTTSILLNTPGESASVMTAIEGNKMAKKGRAAQALATAAIGSFVAGTIGTLAALPLSPVIGRPWSCWNRAMASRVCRPNTPSALSGP